MADEPGSAEPKMALLLLDLQRIVVESYGGTPEVLQAVGHAAAAARSSGTPVIYVVLDFRAGHPEISPRNRTFAGIKAAGLFSGPSDGFQIHDAIARQDGDSVVVKKRISAFAGNDLDLLLRAQGIDTLALCGVATSGVVLSTALDAADRDYDVQVLEDGCGDTDPVLHRVLLDKVLGRRGTVRTTAEWIAERTNART
jgi:nicotinamidase-related amidase